MNLYVVELKILFIYCEFGVFLLEVFRDCFVCGLWLEII